MTSLNRREGRQERYLTEGIIQSANTMLKEDMLKKEFRKEIQNSQSSSIRKREHKFIIDLRKHYSFFI